MHWLTGVQVVFISFPECWLLRVWWLLWLSQLDSTLSVSDVTCSEWRSYDVIHSILYTSAFCEEFAVFPDCSSLVCTSNTGHWSRSVSASLFHFTDNFGMVWHLHYGIVSTVISVNLCVLWILCKNQEINLYIRFCTMTVLNLMIEAWILKSSYHVFHA